MAIASVEKGSATPASSGSIVANTLRAALLCLVAACAPATAPRENVSGVPVACAATFTNPVAPGADPWVTRRGIAYYSVESRGNAIWVYKTDTLTRLKQNPVKVWSTPASGWNQTDVWAPELHAINGRWYIYYAAGMPGPSGPDAAFTDQRSGVLESAGDDPQGAYVDRGMLYTGTDIGSDANPIWAIDLTVLRIRGALYGVWSGWDENRPTHVTPQQLYIARMSNPYTMATNRVRISAPTEAWELGSALNLEEGPEALIHGTDTFIIYSTRESFLPDYRLGMLRLAAPDADPLRAASWIKSGPVFTGLPSAGVYGVGHASFTTSPDGTEDWIVYHAKSVAARGWADRVVRMQRFGWKSDGSPDFGAPVANGVPVRVPSGQCN
ncbi:MAG: glycoside hydrolase family 43 protein [Gemmatimonadota bacterium]|nr:glycoside hydrolase family 43 protein [Gemmatimonadota bacterium]